MKKFFIILSASLLVLASCAPKGPRTYGDAEREFQASLTQSDTLEVLMMGQEFMENLTAGNFDEAFESIAVVYKNVLYKASPEWLSELKDRYAGLQPSEYDVLSLNFSTPGINDLVYRYSVGGPLLDSAPAFKLVLNPVKVEDTWYLTLKDAYMASQDSDRWGKTLPNAPAPEPITLNRKPAAE